MTIALIAHDSKKELMVQFCTAYCRILSQHKLVATGTTGKLIAEATGLQVQRFLAGVQGGDQQIASRIACNEIDLLLFFRDPMHSAAVPTNGDGLRCNYFGGQNGTVKRKYQCFRTRQGRNSESECGRTCRADGRKAPPHHPPSIL